MAHKPIGDVCELPHAVFQTIFDYSHGSRGTAMRFRLVSKKWRSVTSELRIRWSCGSGLNHEQ